MTSDIEDEEDDLAVLLGYEDEVSLSKENRKRLLRMMKHHGVNAEKLKQHSAKIEEKLRYTKPDILPLFSQEQRIELWKKQCGKDGDCLEDYFELFLEQRSELRRRVSRDMLAII